MAATTPHTGFGEALDEHLRALRSRDPDRFAATLGDDVTVVDGKGAITRGTPSVLRSHAEWFGAAERWTFDYDVVLTREFGDAAFALLRVTYRHTAESPPARFLLSLVFARDASGAWRFVYDQNTPLA